VSATKADGALGRGVPAGDVPPIFSDRILLSEPHANAHSGNIASDEAQAFGLRMLSRFDVDWQQYGYDDSAKRGLVEFTLRTMLSFFVAPNEPTRSRNELRRFLKRWLGGAILAQQHSSTDTFEPV
jgi:hypothetical protein